MYFAVFIHKLMETGSASVVFQGENNVTELSAGVFLCVVVLSSFLTTT